MRGIDLHNSCLYINELSCLHNCWLMKEDVATKTLAALCRDTKRTKVTEKRFATLSLISDA